MFCISCHSPNTRVTNSRPHRKRASIWRRRHCQACSATFTTIESVASEGLLSIRSGGSTKPFSFGTLMMSIAPLLSVTSSAADDAYWLTMTAYEKALAVLLNRPANTSYPVDAVALTTRELVEITFQTIERFDSTAALKYALDHKLTQLPQSRAKRPKF